MFKVLGNADATKAGTFSDCYLERIKITRWQPTRYETWFDRVKMWINKNVLRRKPPDPPLMQHQKFTI